MGDVTATDPVPCLSTAAQSAQEWDQVSSEWSSNDIHRLWRQCSDEIHLYWLRRAAPALEARRVLKTDLFDEAFGGGLLEWFAARGANTTGCDLAQRTARSAISTNHCRRAVSADVRHLPFAPGAFDCVVSNSTLDHFDNTADFRQSLGEIACVLEPGGHLLLTMDNPGHPLVWLRNLTPHIWRAIGIVPYQIGLTYPAPRLEAMLRDHGFEIVHSTTILHSPRLLLVPFCSWLASRRANGAPPRLLTRFLLFMERFASLPTRRFTGHFVGIVARKRP